MTTHSAHVVGGPQDEQRRYQREYRRAAANMALQCFAPDTVIHFGRQGRIVVSWTKRHTDEVVARAWQSRRGQDFYPTWSTRWAHGGTACVALSQLVRWIRGQDVLPLATWIYWAGLRCSLAGSRGNEMIDRLKDAQYPERVFCVLCGAPLIDRLDWWHLHGLSGPCCSWTYGCRQRSNERREERTGQDRKA